MMSRSLIEVPPATFVFWHGYNLPTMIKLHVYHTYSLRHNLSQVYNCSLMVVMTILPQSMSPSPLSSIAHEARQTTHTTKTQKEHERLRLSTKRNYVDYGYEV